MRCSSYLQSQYFLFILPSVSTLLSDWRRMPHVNSSTYWFPRFPLRNLCSLVTLAVFSLEFAARAQPTVELLSLELAEWRILHVAPAVIRPRTPLISLSCPATVSLHTLCFRGLLYIRPLVQAVGTFWLLGLHGLPP